MGIRFSVDSQHSVVSDALTLPFESKVFCEMFAFVVSAKEKHPFGPPELERIKIQQTLRRHHEC